MANSNKMNEINKINLQNGYNEIIILSPYTFIKELELAEQTKTTPKPPYIIDATKNLENNDEICFRIPLYESNKRNPQFLGFETKTGQIIACSKSKKNDRIIYKIKTNTNEEIYISNYRLDIYGSFRKPRQIEINNYNLNPELQNCITIFKSLWLETKIDKNKRPAAYTYFMLEMFEECKDLFKQFSSEQTNLFLVKMAEQCNDDVNSTIKTYNDSSSPLARDIIEKEMIIERDKQKSL